MLNIEREVAQQCVQSAQKEMSDKQGVEADQCYIGMQIGAHMYMADKLEVFARHASPELQAVLQQGLHTTQQHLEHAKKIHKSLEGNAQASTEPARQN
jgi:predicted outer membrane protein